ncbi:hypothetical protein Pla123a_02100 [Posidoniimonas polymericola]|uniref:Uncharacterized protein n=1 Tax=Posidoniimonas polymericola TaxID=2528002 RepID=A0A5C5ZFQ9_9BACT|nr:hypothetical protein [Posidoniimonas polymericola]TWT85403.1 hypothetical protein Pla123a_02100 [Posidoniimonas polymericola]
MKSHLKIYQAPLEAADAPLGETVTVPLSEALPLLADAILNNRTWLDDFEDDAVTLSADLYEVLSAYRFLSRPSAG